VDKDYEHAKPNAPYGGTLRWGIVPEEEALHIKAATAVYPSWDLTPRQLCDIDLLLNGGFSPLKGFLGRADYERVLAEMRLVDGTLWPIPVTLDVTREFADAIRPGDVIALRDPEGVIIAVMKVEELWEADKKKEALAVFDTTDKAHPGVDYLFNKTHPVYIAGEIRGLQLPHHYDFLHLRDTPVELREKFMK
jgi:ATP sulfurylase (sulfate adenylyltransferase)